MSEQITVVFGGQPIEVNLYDPATAAVLAQIQAAAAAAAADAIDAEVAAAVALAASVAADWRAARRVRRLAMTVAAAGSAEVKLVLTEDAERTYESGVGPTLATLTAETGQTILATDDSFGSYARAYQTADGIVPSNGLTLDGVTIVDTAGDCSVDLFFVQPAVHSSYATLAAMNAAAGAVPSGSVVHASNPAALMANTYGNAQPLADTLLGLFNGSADFNQGYWVKRPAPYNDFVRHGVAPLMGMGTAATANTLNLSADMLGRLSGFAFNPGIGILGLRSYRQNMIAHRPGKVQHLRIDQQDGVATLLWNGDEVACEGFIGAAAIDFVVNTLYLGGQYTFKALVATQGGTFATRMAVTNAWADELGTPRQNWTPVAEIVAIDSQSEFTGPGSTAPDTWRPYDASGWSGELVGRTNFDIGQDVHQPGVYSGRALTDSARIGPRHSSAGMGGGGTTYGTVAGIAGFASEWRKRPGGDNHLYFVGKCIGGSTLAQLQATSGRYLHAIGEGSVGEIGAALYGELGDRALIEVCKRLAARGQTPRLIYLAQFQGKTDVGIPSTVADHVADLQARLDRAMALIGRGQSRPPLMASMALNYTYDEAQGIQTNALDDQYRRTTASRTIDEPILPLTSVSKLCGPYVHWTAAHIERLMAFLGGRAADHMLLGKYIRPLEPTSVVLGTGGDAGKVVLTYPRAVVAQWADDVTNPSKVVIGGFDTFGFGVIDAGGPALAIGGNVTLTDAAGGGFLKIKIPFTGTWVVGDKLTYLGAGALHGNIREAAAATGTFNGQDWGGVYPIPAATPAINYAGPLHDLREGAAGFVFTYDGAAFV